MKSINEKSATRYVTEKIIVFLLIFIGASILSGILSGFLIGFLSGFLSKDLHYFLNNEKIQMLFNLYGEILFIVITCIYVKSAEKRSLTSIGLNKKVSDYGYGMLIGSILITLSVIGAIIFKGIEYKGFYENINYINILIFLGGFIIQGATEEIMIRGFLMTSLTKKVSLKASVIITSVLFTVLHFGSLLEGKPIFILIGIINLFLISLVFSLLIIKRKNIWSACAAHSVWNFLLYNVYGLNVSGIAEVKESIFKFNVNKESIFNGGSFGLESSLLTIFVLFITVMIMIRKDKKVLDQSIDL